MKDFAKIVSHYPVWRPSHRLRMQTLWIFGLMLMVIGTTQGDEYLKLKSLADDYCVTRDKDYLALFPCRKSTTKGPWYNQYAYKKSTKQVIGKNEDGTECCATLADLNQLRCLKCDGSSGQEFEWSGVNYKIKSTKNKKCWSLLKETRKTKLRLSGCGSGDSDKTRQWDFGSVIE